MLFALLLIGGPITGAHYNPAVTIGVYISNKHWKEDWSMLLVMILGQIFGSVFGISMVWLSLFNEAGVVNISRGGIPIDEVATLLPNAPNVTLANTFVIELVCTFIFVMINLIVKTGKTSPTNDGFLSCLAVSLTLLAMICIAASKSGACLNPAVGIAQTFWSMVQLGNTIPANGYTF
jgi:aquaporin Z